MITKYTTKLLLFITTLVIFASCVNNNDNPAPPPPVDPEELTKDVLVGKWEVYFFLKKLIPTNTNKPTLYRFTENDGFSVTFNQDGTYYEQNVFGHKTQIGEYRIGDYNADDTTSIWTDGAKVNGKKDAIYLRFMGSTGKNGTGDKVERRPRLEVPTMFSTNFTYRFRYNGVADNTKYNIEDARFYRNVEKAPNFLPDEALFKKNNININELLGRWEFYKFQYMIDSSIKDTPLDKQKQIGLKVVFKLDGNKQVFEEYLADGTSNRKGRFDIIDDVVNMFNTYTDPKTGEEVIENFKFWIKKPIYTNGNGERIFEEYDRFRNVHNTLRDIEETGFYRRIGDK